MSKFLIALILTLSPLQAKFQTESCRENVIDLVGETSAEDWNRLPPSLLSMGSANLALLFGVEGARGLMGWPGAFSSAFLVNTAIDPVITILSHIVATSAQNFLSGRFQYLKRASMNTFLNTAVVLAFWEAGAAANAGANITTEEAAAGFGLCAAYYFCIQFVKNKLFVELPRRFDEHLLQKMHRDIGPELTKVLEAAATRGERLEISKTQVEALFLTAFEAAILEIPFEERIRGETSIMQLPKINDLVVKHDKAQSEKQKRRLRRKILFQLLEHQPRIDPALSNSVFDIGAPFSKEQSLRILKTLKDRYWRNKALVWTASIADQGIGVVLAGGVLLRGLTQWAMTVGDPSFLSYFFGAGP